MSPASADAPHDIANTHVTLRGMIVPGGSSIGGGQFQSYDDHRLAMSLGVAGLISTEPITILDPNVAGISYPSYWAIIEELGGLVG